MRDAPPEFILELRSALAAAPIRAAPDIILERDFVRLLRH